MEDRNVRLRNNLASFRDAFKDFADCYTVIGGTACFILMEEAGLNFRATNDIDMILVLEDKGPEFGKIFWKYIIEGGYTCGWRDSGARYYRFTDPNPGYPVRIELFSRRLDFVPDSRIIPVHISDDVSSLSAIALDEDFYDFMIRGRVTVDGISVLGAEYIIPFKMFAWLSNRHLRADGIRVNTDDIKKHKNDVFRLLPLIDPTEKIETRGNVRKNIIRFLSEMESQEVDRNLLGGGRTKEESMRMLRNMYL